MRSILIFTATVLFAFNALSAGDARHPKHVDWHFDGPFGSFDRQSIQRGFKVYKEVCSACHGIKRIAFRNLAEVGFSEEEIKSLASGYTLRDGPNDDGEMFDRPGLASDRIPGPYANEKAARASNNGAYPPDLSLIIKAREEGANYVYSLLTGYEVPPHDFKVGENMYYNPYYAGGGSQFAMSPPLIKDGQVEYTDGTTASIDQMARDVVNFLQWAAEPEMEKRKAIGMRVMIFLGFFTAFMYFAYKRIWKNVK